MDYNRIGKKIQETRISQNKTQEEVALKVGIASSFLSNIETAKRKPSFETLIQIAECLDLSLDYLILDKDLDKKMKEDIYIKKIYKKLEPLDEVTKEKLIDIMIYISKKI